MEQGPTSGEKENVLNMKKKKLVWEKYDKFINVRFSKVFT